MRVGILQPGYLPWLGFFEQVFRCDTFVLYDDVQFDKNSWRNRNRIKTPDGPLWLTVPVYQKDHTSQTLLETKIVEKQDWARKHLNSIKAYYSKAHFFSLYFSALSEILQRGWTYLVDLDIALIHYLLRELGIMTPVIRSSALGMPGEKTDRLVAICNALGATAFYEGAAGRNYIEEEQFKAGGIILEYQDYHHPTYPQLYGAFTPYLSVIDLLFNCGKESLKIIIGEKAV
ncbi:MAG: WbqC family protein [Pseudomonadota bacterium]